jgi:hypothetical protein
MQMQTKMDSGSKDVPDQATFSQVPTWTYCVQYTLGQACIVVGVGRRDIAPALLCEASPISMRA